MGFRQALIIGAVTIYILYRLATRNDESPPGRPEQQQQQQQQEQQEEQQQQQQQEEQQEEEEEQQQQQQQQQQEQQQQQQQEQQEQEQEQEQQEEQEQEQQQQQKKQQKKKKQKQKKKRHVFDEDDDARRKEQAEARLQQQYRTTTTSVYPDTSTLAGNRRSSTQQTSINQPSHTYHPPTARTGVSQEHISRQTQRTQVLRPRPSRTDYSIPLNFNESETYRRVEETSRPSVLYKPRRTSILEEDDTADATQSIDTGDNLRADAMIERESMMQCRKEAKDASGRGDYVVANDLN
ncbi:hypothetical protein FRC02_007100, partial [Tulasnella sp. 418]